MHPSTGEAESEKPHAGVDQGAEVGWSPETGRLADYVLGSGEQSICEGRGEQVADRSLRSNGQGGHQGRLDDDSCWSAGYWENVYALGDLQWQFTHAVRRLQRQGPAHEDSQRIGDWLRRVRLLRQEGEQLLKGYDHY